MSTRDPYEVLGVPRDASADEIKSAYRRLARRYHPDVNRDDPKAEEMFKEIGSAYALLSDAQRKQRYDQFGTTDDGPGDQFFQGGGISDLFEMFFGGMGGQGQRRRAAGRDGEDIRADVEITLLEVLSGTHRDIVVNRSVLCSECNGQGTEGGKQPDSCGTCAGQGAVTRVQNTFLGSVRTSVSCPTCHGTGTIIKAPCKNCTGRGTVAESARVGVTIPPGVETGQTIHLPGQGGEGVGMGRSGDLYVVLSVADGDRFERQGTTLYKRMTVTYAQAQLGDLIEIEGVSETHEVELPSATQPGARLIVRGGGVPPLHGGKRGDLILQVDVKIPRKISETQEKLLREYAELGGEPIPKGTSKGLLGNLFGKKK